MIIEIAVAFRPKLNKQSILSVYTFDVFILVEFSDVYMHLLFFSFSSVPIDLSPKLLPLLG